MRVGILSMQRVKNYGSFLQAYSLQRMLQSFGCKCEFVDIQPGKQLQGIETSKSYMLKAAWKKYGNPHFASTLRQYARFSKRFVREFIPELVGAAGTGADDYDLIVIGSDEVFNFVQHVPWGFSTQLYGNIDNAKRIISFAASFGNTRFEDVVKYGVQESISRGLRNLDAISVRDDNSAYVVNKLIGIVPRRHLDPVLIHDFSDVESETDSSDYILIYTYPGRMNESDEARKIVSYGRRQGKRLISVGFWLPWCDNVITPHPFELLSYFKKSFAILTDTFHGCVLAMKYHKNFAAMARETNANKILSLLGTMNLEKRLLEPEDDLGDLLASSPDYSTFDEVVRNGKNEALEYMEPYLNGTKGL